VCRGEAINEYNQNKPDRSYGPCRLDRTVRPNGKRVHSAPGVRNPPEADRIPNAKATEFMMNTYPPVLQEWINRHGGLTPQLIYLRGNELAAIVPKC
jgi:hypothetical protein